MFWRSIGFKLVVLIIAFSSVCVGAYVYFLDKELRQQYENDVFIRLHIIGERIFIDLKEGMMIHGNVDISQSIRKISDIDTIRNVIIVSKTGLIRASTNKKENGSIINQKNSYCVKCHEAPGKTGRISIAKNRSEEIIRLSGGERIAETALAIPNQPGCSDASCHGSLALQKTIGFMDVEISLREVDHRLMVRRLKNLGFAAFLVLGLSATAGIFTFKIIYLPLREVIRGTQAVASGNLDKKIMVINKHDEIGYLANSFNNMTGRIKEMTDRLSEMNLKLEHKVAERTKELEETRDSILQAEKLSSLGLMAAAIAHEINNPLTAVLTYSSLLMKVAEEGSETKEDLQVIVSETTRCREIVRGLLDFARETDFRLKPVNINNLLEQMLTLLIGQVIFQDIKIIKDFAKFIPISSMDEDQIKQVFVNIILNAADAMPNGGVLRIRTVFDYELNEFMVEIHDSGIGIPEHDVKKIFDPFFTSKEKGKGTGLGLSVAYGIIQRHSGSIHVKSKVGKGTTFIVTFPVS